MIEVQTFDVRFDSGSDFDVSFDAGRDFGSGFDDMEIVEIKDHRELVHRDASNQHPISAITDLFVELQARPDTPIPDSFIDNL